MQHSKLAPCTVLAHTYAEVPTRRHSIGLDQHILEQYGTAELHCEGLDDVRQQH